MLDELPVRTTGWHEVEIDHRSASTRTPSRRTSPHPGRRWSDLSERMITIANEIPRHFVPRKRLAELLDGPRRRRMGGDRHVHNTATLVRQDDQHEEESIWGGGHHEEIGGCDLADMIREKRAPRL